MKILVAEDDEVSQMLLCSILADTGHEVVPVSDGAAAWAALQEHAGFELAIFDVMMPGLSGLELLARVRGDRRFTTLPIILCTALNDRATVTQAAALEINHYIVKPYSRATVLEKIRSVASTRDSVDALERGEAVCERLGLTRDQWSDWLGKLDGSVTQWISEAHQVLRAEDMKELALRANALKGACVNLGASGLAEQLAAAEVALSELEPTSTGTSQAFMSDPFVFSELASITASVQREAVRFQQALKAVAGENAP